MYSFAKLSVSLAMLTGAIFVLPIHAQVVEDPNGFSFTVPTGFRPAKSALPTQVVATGYHYERIASRDQPGFHFVIQPLDGPVEPGEVAPFPNDPTGAVIRETWQGTTVYGARHSTDMPAFRAVFFTAWIDLPLDPRPVRVTVVGNVLAERQGRQLLRELLGGVTGRLAEPAPEVVEDEPGTDELAEEPGESHAPLVVAILLTVAAVAGAWFILRRQGPQPPLAAPQQPDAPPEPPPEAPKPPITQQPPWAVTRDSPGPKPESDVPPWEYRP